MEVWCFFPFVDGLAEQDGFRIFKAKDQVDIAVCFWISKEFFDQGFDWCNPSPTSDDEHIFLSKFCHWPPMTIGSPHKDRIPFAEVKQFVGHFTDVTDGKVTPTVAIARNRNRCFPHSWNRQLHKLTIFNRQMVFHAEGPFCRRFFDDINDFMRCWQYRISFFGHCCSASVVVVLTVITH